MDISVPPTQYIVELGNLFSVSTEYLSGVEKTSTINITGLSEKDVEIIYILVEHLKTKN